MVTLMLYGLFSYQCATCYCNLQLIFICIIYLFFLELCGYVLKQLSDRQVLRADLFAFSAFQAVRRFAAGCGVDGAIVIVGVPVVIELLCIHGSKEIGD